MNTVTFLAYLRTIGILAATVGTLAATVAMVLYVAQKEFVPAIFYLLAAESLWRSLKESA